MNNLHKSTNNSSVHTLNYEPGNMFISNSPQLKQYTISQYLSRHLFEYQHVLVSSGLYIQTLYKCHTQSLRTCFFCSTIGSIYTYPSCKYYRAFELVLTDCTNKSSVKQRVAATNSLLWTFFLSHWYWSFCILVCGSSHGFDSQPS